MQTLTDKIANIPRLDFGEVSLFQNALARHPEGDGEIYELLKSVKTGEWKTQVTKLRQHLRQDRVRFYDEEKRKLPAVSLSATLITRHKDIPLTERVQKHSGWLQGDFDEKDNAHLDLEEARKLLENDPHVGFVFLSPSGQGLKAGIYIDGTKHLESFLSAEKYFLEKYSLKIDPSVKDVTRLCFVSYDPELWVCRELPATLPITEVSKSKRRSVSFDHDDNNVTEADMKEMLSFIQPRPVYQDWLRISSAVWSVLSFESGARLLNEWSPEEQEGEYFRKYQARLKQININTLVWYAQQNGFDAKVAAQRKYWAGRIRFATREDKIVEPDLHSSQPIIESDEDETEIEFYERCLDKEQEGDAEIWAAEAKKHLRYDYLLKSWRIFKDGIWSRDAGGTVHHYFGDTLRDAYGKLLAYHAQDMAQFSKDDPRFTILRRIETRRTSLGRRYWMEGCFKYAQNHPGLLTNATEFDKQSHLLAIENGTIDFKELVFREHRAEDKLSMHAPVKFQEDRTCPNFDAFLERAMGGDQELIAYIWRAIAYSMTGYVDQDVLFFCYGKGANGKSTFNNVLQMLCGELMTIIDIEVLLTNRSDSSTDYKKAMLEGKRVVVTDEIPENRKLNESIIKSLIGGEDILARRPFEKPYQFSPTHKIWMVGNHKPKITGTDHGIWRRIHMIPWLVTIPKEERKPRHEILASFRIELPGILNRALAGWDDYVAKAGLNPPEAVLQATEAYRDENDHFGSFLIERTVSETLATVKATELLKTYLAWCEDNGETPVYRTSKRLLNILRERGFGTRLDRNKSTFVDGLRIFASEELI